MKITQEPKFQPITIILETAEEAKIMREMICGYPYKNTAFPQELSNWFSNHAQLGGKP